jgi:hypothetical protein
MEWVSTQSKRSQSEISDVRLFAFAPTFPSDVLLLHNVAISRRGVLGRNQRIQANDDRALILW